MRKVKLRGEVIYSVSYSKKGPGAGGSNPGLADGKAHADQQAACSSFHKAAVETQTRGWKYRGEPASPVTGDKHPQADKHRSEVSGRDSGCVSDSKESTAASEGSSGHS